VWRGYVTAQFLACRVGSEEPFLCSSPFPTWRLPWHPKLPLDELPAAVAALHGLVGELARHGWHPIGRPGAWNEYMFVRHPSERLADGVRPPRIGDQFVLGALGQVAGTNGATAAELGRALYGDDASSVQRLPQRIGTRLRALQLQGKVDRREDGGVSHWFVTSPADRRAEPGERSEPLLRPFPRSGRVPPPRARSAAPSHRPQEVSREDDRRRP